MEHYRRNTADEPVRDPETGHVQDPTGAADDRTVYDQAADPVHTSGRTDLSEPSGLGEPAVDAERAKRDEQSDLIVYPEEADYPTRSGDSSLTAGVPDLEPEPVLVTHDGDKDNDVARPEAGTADGTGAIDFQQRWREVQAGFVDDTRDAVERADQLVDEAVTALTSRKQGLVDRWKNGDQNDTEKLRLALRDYRSLLEELVGVSYSTAGQESLPAHHEAR
jgi:hypothetical protein